MHGFEYIGLKIHAPVIRYTSIHQLSIEQFKTPFQVSLDVHNRWVKLANKLPWDKLARIYHKTLSNDQGAPSIDARIVIGALIVKHKMKLDDRETIQYIKENMYVQFFLGLSNYTAEDVFDRSLFTLLRYRLGADKFDQMSCSIISTALGLDSEQDENEVQTAAPHKDTDLQDSTKDLGSSSQAVLGDDQVKQQEKLKEKEAEATKAISKFKGKLKLDATVADQMIKYPTDLDLLNASRQESERIIDILCKILQKEKPRIHRRKARQEYLSIAKKKKKTGKQIRKAIGKQLNFLKRNLTIINGFREQIGTVGLPLSNRDQEIYQVIQRIYGQQHYMYKHKTHQCEDRIVNIYQPYVRPMVRGKAKAPVEFGAKLGVSEFNGYARINKLNWNAYHEAADLKIQVEEYQKLFGYYPAVVIADKIYGTRENRNWLSQLGIRFSGKPLGRPSKASQTPYQKRRSRKENAERNHVEGKFGQAKNGYNLNKIRARRARTSESWIACIFFVMNLIRFNKDFFVSCWKSIFSALLHTRPTIYSTKIQCYATYPL